MSGYNIGPKIGIDGEAEFRRQISQINTEYKTLTAQTKAVTAAFEANGDEQQMLTSRTKVLQAQIETQARKAELLEDAIAKATQKFGEGSVEVTRLEGALYDTQATSSSLEAQLRDTERQLTELESGTEEASDAAEEASESYLEFSDVLGANLSADMAADALKEVAQTLVEVGQEAIEAASDVKAQTSQFEQTFGDMQSAAASALKAISDETSIAVTRMQGSYTALYAFSKTAGAESEEALSYATRAMSAAADSAAYYDKSIEEATESLQSFLKGNYANDAALGISATETTRNAKANEMYAVSFKELSESQKVDVLLAMVEAGNAASGALGQAARESGAWANVTGELEEAQKQLLATLGSPVLEAVVPIIQKITDSIYDLMEVSSWDELSDSIDDFDAAMTDAQDATKKTAREVEGSVYVAERYIKRLQDLEEAGMDTAESQQEYASIVELLNELVPDLNLSIDEQTGLLEQNTDAIIDEIDAWKERSIAQALQEQLTAEIEAQAKAVASVRTAETRLVEVEMERKDILGKLESATEKVTEENKDLNGTVYSVSTALMLGSAAADGLNLSYQDVKISTSEAAAEEAALREQLLMLRDEEAALNLEIQKANELIAESEGQIQTTSAAWNRYSASLTVTEEAHSGLDSAVQEVMDTMLALRTEYDETVISARESIDSQIGFFDKLATESDWTAQKIVDNWLAQQNAFNNYSANLQKAVAMNLPQELVNQLSDGSEESMLILDTLVNDTDVSVDEIVAAFGGMSAARNKVATVTSEIKLDFTNSMAELKEQARLAGIDTAQGLADGIASKTGAITKAMGSAANSGIKAYKDVMLIQSPSRTMYDAGDDTVEGAVIAVEDRTKDFAEAMADMAAAGQLSYLQERLNAAEMYPNLVPSGIGAATTTNAVSTNYGGVSINVYQQPGEDAQDFAYRLMDIMQTEVIKKGVALNA